MDFNLSNAHLELQAKAKEFTEQVLFPHEMECEVNDGISRETHQKIIASTLEWEFNAPNHSKEDGGQGFSIFEQTLLNEQLGKATGAIWDALWYPSYPMRFATKAQKEEYLIPTCLGARRDAYAITEADAGSDPTQCVTRADKVDGGWKINGEKWFVTIGDIADYLLVHAHVDGDPAKPTVFFVDKNLPGVEVKRTPLYTHHFAFKHPEFTFTDVIVGDDKVLGDIGQGFDMTKDWFVEARLGIAARCVGGAIRAAEEANRFAAERIQFGQPVRDFQAIEFMLADMAVEIMAAKSMLYRLSWEIDQTQDRKRNHARAAALKLHCSEMVGRVCDRALQILGGRGYMREQAVERLWRDTRVDRIWEGTSEIQRVIIGGQIKKRGMDIYTGW
ncbi:acyl-CoA/acyl-ACP dehydrogenase [Parasalinivibrio latis]|uniref:acyl-CoA dehydrogenase family protein n=1 Tax=Parasalinivibrio latis TaxID=2952610 RepID=UPI0030E377D7